MVSTVDGSFWDNPTYQVLYNEYLMMKAKRPGQNFTFENFLMLTNRGYDKHMQDLENLIETGDINGGDGIDGNTLSGGRHVDSETGENEQMFQTEDRDGYIDINWDAGEYTYTEDTNVVAAALGLDVYNFNFDTIVFGNGKAEITDFTFGGLDDGQDRGEYNVNGFFKNVTYALQEFDPCYIFDASLADTSDPEYQKAMSNWNYLINTADQWLTLEEQAELGAMDPSSVEYKQKLLNLILDRLDQLNEFSEHSHVKNTGSLSGTDGTGGVDNSGGVNGSGSSSDDGSENSTTLEYSKRQVIKDAGLYSDYMAGTNWSGSWHEHGDRRSCRNAAIADGKAYIAEVIENVIDSLKAQAGSNWTSEMQKYAETVEDELVLGFKDTSDEGICDNGRINNNNYWGATDCKACGAKDARAIVKIDNLLNAFFSKFDALCKSGGKTEAEVNAEKAEKEALKSNYQTFYNYNVKSLSVSNIKSEYKTSMLSGNYKDDAKNNVLTPYADKLLSTIKSKCPKLSQAQIQAIIDAAVTNTLANDSWVSTSGTINNGGTYNISTDKLLTVFGEQIKAAIVASGGYKP